MSDTAPLKTCVDCGQHEESMDYMVKNKVWKESGAKVQDCLCLNCLSMRLYRSLTINDFNLDLPINAIIKYCYLNDICSEDYNE